MRDLLDVETDIVGLDVMGVKMEWPPAITTDVEKERNLKVYFFWGKLTRCNRFRRLT